ncbi:MAG: hypothetical protein ABR941_02530 [Thermoleophilia bacterium]
MEDERGRPHEPTSSMTMLRRGAVPFLCGLVALGLLAFIVQNGQRADVHWLAWTFTAPLWIDLMVPAVGAVLVAGLAAVLVVRRRRRKTR